MSQLGQFIEGSVFHGDTVLHNLIAKADELKPGILVLFCYPANRIDYIGKGIEYLSGYPQNKFMKLGGFMIMSVTLPEEIPIQMAVQASYIQKCKTSGFDPRTAAYQNYEWTLVHRSGEHIPILSIGIILTYTSDYDPEQGIGFHIDKRNVTEKEKQVCHQLLKQIKERHNQIHIHPVRNMQGVPYFTNYLHDMMHCITGRERQVLGMIALGNSSRIISKELGISFHTVETHRKKLLEKFKARNTAELLTKASKIFWLG
jgi:DNA-binding CsgD family transcriptional regulator